MIRINIYHVIAFLAILFLFYMILNVVTKESNHIDHRIDNLEKKIETLNKKIQVTNNCQKNMD